MVDTLVDAGPLFAVICRDDPLHERCAHELARLVPPLYTTLPVLTEAMYLLGRWTLHGQMGLWTMLLRGDLNIADLTRPDLHRMSELMAKYGELPMDFADASLVAVAERLGVDRVFTVDRADFSVYRLHGTKPFTILGP